MDFPYGETVTRLRRGLVSDPYSGEDTLADWATATSVDIELCAVVPGGSIEPSQDAREAVATDFIVYAPTTSDVVAQDRLVVRGLTCDIVGRPADWRSPFVDWWPGLEIKASIVEG